MKREKQLEDLQHSGLKILHLLPIKDEDGNFKYVDFSHANAYDTLIRPLQSVVNAVQDGRTDEDGIMDDFAKGLFTAMSEFGQPFISESIWTEAVSRYYC